MLGKITGKVTTLHFQFEVLPKADVNKFEYVKVHHRVYEWVLCQAVEIETSQDKTIAKCNVLGYLDDDKVKQIRIPFDIDSEVFLADDDFIQDVIRLTTDQGAMIGKLDGKEIPVNLDLSQLLTKHVAVLAKSGAGKSYAVGVLLEEILERKVPIIVIDPHGEYGSLKEKNPDSDNPKAYKVKEYGDPNTGHIPISLPGNFTQQELIHLLPGKLSNSQLGVLYSAIKGMDTLTLEAVQIALEQEESNAKWSIINLIEHLRQLNIFSTAPISYNELVKSGIATIINLRGYSPDIQQIITYKLAKDLFELRKVNRVAPFFLVIEEAHNFCPERSFGETASSKVLRTIASEGRKFGLGLCVISQRPARVDKSVLSQCTTQIVLKVTNPNDLRAVGASIEGLTQESEAEIQNLPIGTALVTGVVDMPLFVNIRERKTKHGGHAVDILDQPEDFIEAQQDFQKQELIPIIKPKTTLKDKQLMADNPDDVIQSLNPGYLFSCKDKDDQFRILVDMTRGEIVVDLEDYKTAKLPTLDKLSQIQVKILQRAHSLRQFDADQIAKKIGALDVQEDLTELVDLAYLQKQENKYSLTDNYILSKLSKHATYATIQFEQTSIEKNTTKLSLDKMKSQLAKFTNVLDQQECNILVYNE